MRITSIAMIFLSGALLAQAPPPSTSSPATTPAATAAPIDPATPIITIAGLCPEGTPAADCRTVISKADFDKLLEVAGPNMPAAMRRQAAEQYAHMLVRSKAAEAMNLQGTPKFEQQMKLVRLQVLSQFLTRSLQEKAAEIPDEELKKYYDDNQPKYEQVTMERLFIPKTRVHAEPKPAVSQPKTPGKAEPKATPAPDPVKVAAADEAYMKAVAEGLQKRAAAGEKFEVLEKEGMAKTGSPGPAPTTAMGKMSRGQLPATHAFVFDLKSGEVSTLISDASGFYIYHLLKKEFQPFEVVKPQIKAQLSSQRAQDALKKVDDAAKIEVNDAYFGPPGPTAGAFHGPTGAAPKPTPVPQPKPKQ